MTSPAPPAPSPAASVRGARAPRSAEEVLRSTCLLADRPPSSTTHAHDHLVDAGL